LRLLHAVRLLEESEMPLVEVAADAGFADQSHLTRNLKRRIHATPGAVRSNALHRFKTKGAAGR
jgi:AraC family transcriptional regulator